MPSIKGIEIRDFKQWETRRGIAYEADLYIDNERIGSFENKGIGGATSITILNQNGNREKFKEAVVEYYQENPAQYETDEQFVEELMALWDDFEIFTDKAQGKIMLAVLPHSRLTPIEDISMDNLTPTYYAFDNEPQLEAFLTKEKPGFYKVYRSLEDFDIK